MSEIDHPDYYGGDQTYEVVKIIEAHGLYGNGYRCQALQYLLRADLKSRRPEDRIADLQKAVWWINREIARREAGLTVFDAAVTPTGSPDHD